MNHSKRRRLGIDDGTRPLSSGLEVGKGWLYLHPLVNLYTVSLDSHTYFICIILGNVQPLWAIRILEH